MSTSPEDTTAHPHPRRTGPITFTKQSADELRKVVTPTRDELTRMTLVVLAFLAFMIALVMGLDYLFGTGASLLFG